MKKLTILGICLTVGLAASAQMGLVKDVEAQLKSGNADYQAAFEAIKPALTNPESKDQAQTWYVAGKTGFDGYDKISAMQAFGQEIDKKGTARMLLDGYEYIMTALPLDTVVNEKGKVKTKYSKDIVKTVAGHFGDFFNAGVMCWEAQDWDGANKLWAIYEVLPYDARLGKDAPAALADTIRADVAYNRALALYQMSDYKNAVDMFKKSAKLGNSKKGVYDYAISAAVQAGDNDAVYALAQEALPLFGKEDPKFMQLIINSHILKKEYDQAKQMLDNALAEDPNNSQYLMIMGILLEEQGKADEAADYYQKAAQAGPENAMAQYQYGRSLCEKAYKLGDTQGLSQAEYNKLLESQINPLFREAATYLEKAYQLDNNQTDALRYLKNVYYNLHDEANQQRIEDLL